MFLKLITESGRAVNLLLGNMADGLTEKLVN